MTETNDFPIVISPNLGCPLIVSLEELAQKNAFPLIIAGRHGGAAIPLQDEFVGALYLRRSYENTGNHADIPLVVHDKPQEITDWNQLSDFKNAEDTRAIINSEFHYKVMGEHTRYWKINVSIDNKLLNKTILRPHREKEGRYLPCLYDLIYTDKSRRWEKVNYHSLQFVDHFESACNFIHLTDLHLATRNDEIIDEVLKEKNGRGRDEIIKSYINFNENLRRFIKKANELVDEGKLDFVVITGDIVDYAFHGWEGEPNYDENNWKTFVNIITGTGLEGTIRNNVGIKVAIFTSTGNHDWRLHPYDPNGTDYNRKSFGLNQQELNHYNFKYFDSTEYPGDKRARLSEEITSDALKKMNFKAFPIMDKLKKYSILCVHKPWFQRAFPILGLTSAAGGMWTRGNPTNIGKGIYVVIVLASWIAPWLLRKLVERILRKTVDFVIDNPLHAEACALHYYLRYVNPYLDYAFSYGGHTFIVMDTGSDVFVGQLLDGKKAKELKRISLADNILGGSPDSRAFDSEKIYYNWSQIIWLEKALLAISNKQQGKNKTFVFLHAPPINPPDDIDLSEVRESKLNGKSDKWIPAPEEHSLIYEYYRLIVTFIKSKFCKPGIKKLKPGEGCNLTYGSVNHYLSQFFYLCLGYRESELTERDSQRKFNPVDIVFSGHAHKNIEFRIEKGTEVRNQEVKHVIRIYHDCYSNNGGYNCWGESPVVVQTAACGIAGDNDNKPPYYRNVAIDNSSKITGFGYLHLG